MTGRHLAARALGAAALAVAFCAGAAAQQFTMKLGHPTAHGVQTHWAETFKARLAARVGGRINVEIYPASQLGSIPRMIEGTQLGTIELVDVPPAFLTGLDERFAVLDAPGVFRDMAHGFRTVHDPAFKAAFWGVGEAKGVKLIGLTCDTGTDYATKAPLRALADFKNLKLRIFGSKLEVEALARLGAAGVPMPLSDALPALQNNQIDGVRSGIPVFVPFKYESVAKYILKEKESFVFTGKYVSLAWLDKLPADLRAAVIEEAAAADPITQDFAIKFVETLYAQWQQKGGTLAELSAAEQKALRETFASVGAEAFKDRPQALAVLNVMTAAAARLQAN